MHSKSATLKVAYHLKNYIQLLTCTGYTCFDLNIVLVQFYPFYCFGVIKDGNKE